MKIALDKCFNGVVSSKKFNRESIIISYKTDKLSEDP